MEKFVIILVIEESCENKEFLRGTKMRANILDTPTITEITNYAEARGNLHRFLDAYNIPRNDNLVGRIGEYIAIEYIKGTTSDEKVTPVAVPNQKGFDFSVGNKKYTVKTITNENKNGATSPLDLTNSWDYLVAVRLGDNFELVALSIIDYHSLKTQLDSNSIQRNRKIGTKKPFRWWQILNDDRYKKV